MSLTWAQYDDADVGHNINFKKCVWADTLGLFVAVGFRSGGSAVRIETSPDGINWTLRTSSSATTWNSVAWSSSLGIFVGVAASLLAEAMSSTDGITWTSRTTPANNSWEDVVWADSLGLFVAVASSGANRVMTSPDGINWTARSASSVHSWAAIAWSGSELVATADETTATLMRSTDGINWSDQSFGGAVHIDKRGLGWAGGSINRFGAYVQSPKNIYTSPTGVTWTAQNPSTSLFSGSQLHQFAFSTNSGIWALSGGVGAGGNDVVQSTDGSTWTVSDTLALVEKCEPLTYSPALGLFVGVNGVAAGKASVGTDLFNASITPDNGIASGGDSVAIHGTNINGGFFGLKDALYVAFDTTANIEAVFGVIDTATTSRFVSSSGLPLATRVSASDDSHLTCLTPTGTGLCSVVVWNNDPTFVGPNILAYLPDAFTFNNPVITSITPSTGTVQGGTQVTITGTDLFDLGLEGNHSSVTFGGTLATDFVLVDDSTITCVTPAHTAGVVDVVFIPSILSVGIASVIYPNSTLTAAYTYRELSTRVYEEYIDGVANTTPELGEDGLEFPLLVEPGFGCSIGGSQVFIVGGDGDFQSGATVDIGGNPATGVTFVDDHTLSVTTPAHANGLVTVTVTNPDTSSFTQADAFRYATPWWRKTFTILVDIVDFGTGLTLDTEEFHFYKYVQSCDPPTDGTWRFLSFTDPSLSWWTFNNLYTYQATSPGTGWTASSGPVSNNGWYYSTAAYGGSVVVVDTGSPSNPRTWTDISAWATGNTGMLGGSPAAGVTINNRMIYPITSYSVGTDYPPIQIFDGSFKHELCRLPPTTTNTVPKAVMSMLAANATIYLTSFDSGTTSANWSGRVFELDYLSGTLTPLGSAFAAGEMPYALAWHNGRLWCGTNNGIGTVGKVYYFRPGIDTSWNLDHSLATESLGGVDSMISYGGKLYVGSDNSAGNRGKILVRDTAGAYTVSDTGTGGTAKVNNGFLAMATFGSNLYASYWNPDTPTAIAYIRKFDGASWSTVYTGATTTLRPFILLFQDNGTLFAMGGGDLLSAAILTTTNGTSWTNESGQLPDSTHTLLPIYGIEIL